MDGILVVNKSQGMTSRDVVNRVQRLTGIRKCGHAGTLDPMATGVLVICLGRTTRLVRYVQKMRKRYRARFRFGFTSDTDDIEGIVTPVDAGTLPDEKELQQALQENLGDIEQVPPQYSAVKIKGKQAYKLAREGKSIDLKSRIVSIYQFQLLGYEPPDWESVIECGSGTYVRSLGRDLGQRFGCGAVMTFLCREVIGNFTLEQAATLEEIEDKGWQEQLLPARNATAELAQFQCNSKQAEDIWHGKPMALLEAANTSALEITEEELAILDPQGELLAVAEINHQLQLIKPRIVLRG